MKAKFLDIANHYANKQNAEGDNIDPKSVMALMKDLQALPHSLVSLPLPKRVDLPEISELRRCVGGNIHLLIQELVAEGASTDEIVSVAFHNDTLYNYIRDRGYSKTSIEGYAIASRFHHDKAPIFTLRQSLNQQLYDMDIGGDIPTNFLRPPFECCYVEFGEPEERHNTPIRTYTEGHYQILEGAYLIHYPERSIEHLEQKTVEALELDRSKPARMIEICFTGSPIESKEPKEDGLTEIASDRSDIINIFIQDEEEPIDEMLKRHFIRAIERENSSHSAIYGSSGVNDKFVESMHTNMIHLTKALIYINSDRKVQQVERDFSDLEKRLRDAKNPKKLPKMKKQLQRSYDRILLGPKRKYVPIDETLHRIRLQTGVKPHLRRAHFGLRWTGEKRSTAKISWIKPTLVNAGKIKGADEYIKDYLVF